jgi:energy-coupling factor transporter transmembrane protein EcfT
VLDVALIDHWAASGTGPLHRASTRSKVFFLLLVVAAAVVARSPYPLMGGYVLLVVIAGGAGLPLFRMISLSLYAILFALLYGISLHGDFFIYQLLAFKAITPAFAMLTIMMTTPSHRIFSLISPALPEAVTAGLFMTYRTLFILIEMMGNFSAAIRLRGGFSPGRLAKNSANISKGLAMLLVKAVERASRLYAVMSVRGYNGSMAQGEAERFRREDCLPIGTGVLVLAMTIFWKQ